MESPESIALSDGSFRLGLATVSQLALRPEFDDKLAALIRRDGGAERAVRALRREFLGEGPEETITIPEKATVEGLVAQAKAAYEEADIPFTFFDDNVLEIIRHDLELVKGKTLQVLEQTFGRWWTTQEGRYLQKGQGFDGNAAALLVWVIQTRKRGWFVSIANTDDRLFRDDGDLCAPYFGRGEQDRRFDLRGVRDEWGGAGVLVAFRVI
jgi:hypothetical protein